MNYTQPPVLPFYKQSSPDQAIDLGKHEIQIEQSKYQAQVSIEFQPAPRLQFNTSPSQADCAKLANRQSIDVRLGSETFAMSPAKLRCGSHEQASCALEPFGDKPVPGARLSTEIARAVVHLFNFPNFVNQPADTLSNQAESSVLGVADLLAGNWKIRISGNGETRTATDALEKGGRFVITHAVEITKNNGCCFSVEELRNVIAVLSEFLSFVAGRRCSAAMPVAYNKEGAVVWEDWRMPLIAAGPWKPWRSWFDRMNGQSLAAAFPGFYAKWCDTTWPRVFERTVYWYLRSNEDAEVIATDRTLVLSQIVMEMLAAVAGIPDQGSAAQRLEKLLCTCKIPKALPDICKELGKATEDSNRGNTNSANALTMLRNKIVHPKQNDPMFAAGYDSTLRDQAYHQASCLALELLDLMLLSYIDYSGFYRSRFETGYVGNVKRVPWQVLTAI